MYVAIIGSRTFTDYQLLKDKCLRVLSRSKNVTIISGGAKGADSLAERFAAEFKLPIIVVKADWQTHGRSAGMIRNNQLLSFATHAIAFWNGESKGTSHMITNAINQKKEIRIIDF
jgi:hypothetical protein